ncbi:MAG: TAXI family TRAP transporter solute-binding subunit [Pseudomonadota bacterium]
MKRFLLASLIFVLAASHQAPAQTAAEKRTQVNDGVVGLVAARRTGTMTVFADDMAAILNEVPGLRVLPILGRGSLGNIEDLLYLRGVDVALTQGDVLDFYKTFKIESNVDAKLGYIAALGLEEAHLLARQDIRSVDELEGRKVNFGWNGSGSFLSASIIFDNLGVKVDAGVDIHKVAMVKLQNGEIDAMFWMGGSPIDSFEELRGDEGLHLLPIPNDRISASTYAPTTLDNSDYPNLIPPGQTIETVEVSTVMAAYKWPEGHPRRTAVGLFARSLFENAETFHQDPYHPKWKTMDLAADVPGWSRVFPLVQLTSR